MLLKTKVVLKTGRLI